jgi:hypothetical protein
MSPIFLAAWSPLAIENEVTDFRQWCRQQHCTPLGQETPGQATRCPLLSDEPSRRARRGPPSGPARCRKAERASAPARVRICKFWRRGKRPCDAISDKAQSSATTLQRLPPRASLAARSVIRQASVRAYHKRMSTFRGCARQSPNHILRQPPTGSHCLSKSQRSSFDEDVLCNFGSPRGGRSCHRTFPGSAGWVNVT